MPLWPDLGDALAKELSDYSATSVLDAISAYEYEYGRARLIERLAELMHLEKARPGPAHREFCSLPFDIVCTTNFDFLLEKQYDLEREANRGVHPVVDEDQLSINIGTAGTLLLKLHGDLRHPKRMVVTETDYDGFLATYPLIATYLSNLLITKTAILIGYSLDDPDFRQMWQVVTNRLGKTRRLAYAILVNAQPGNIARFERRGVKVVNLPGSREKYGDILAEAFKELREYRRDNAAPTLKPTEERPLEQFLLPRDAASRLFYFSIPLDLSPFYRERIFPAAEAAGFVPVTASDVVNLGDSVIAKIDTLIDRAAVMLIDLSSQNTRTELGLALSRSKEVSEQINRKPLRLILIKSEGEDIPSLAAGHSFITRPHPISEQPDEFVHRLTDLFYGLAAEMGIAQAAEPRRLFDAKEYRASVIAAMTLLEATLRQRLDTAPWSEVRRPATVMQLLDFAMQNENIPRDLVRQVPGWVKIRNAAVHTARPVSKTEARIIVEGIEVILAILH